MSPAAAAGRSDVNATINEAVKSNHKPVPCAKSRLNAEARQWWAWSSSKTATHIERTATPSASDVHLRVPTEWPEDFVYITQNLVAASVPESIAQRYVLTPSPSAPQPTNPTAAGPSRRDDLPSATHNDGRPSTLFTPSIQDEVPLVIHRIDRQTPWHPESFHSTSRNLTAHPAAGSFGLFAAQDIAGDTFIRPYLGVLHTKADADFYSTYDLSLCHDPRLLPVSPRSSPQSTDELSDQVKDMSLDSKEKREDDPTALYLDSRYWGNESRFVNDYRGIAAKPNVEFRSFVQLSDGEERFQMGLFSVRPIRKGQELLINYGKSFWIHFEQLAELERAAKAKEASQPEPRQEQHQPPAKTPSNTEPPAGAKLDPIQAMLARSRMRVSRTAPNRPPSQP